MSQDGSRYIRTSAKRWMEDLARAYKERIPFTLEDDAEVGIDPRADTILTMGLRAKLRPRDWYGVVVALGVAAAGAWLLVMAVLDPEPYSKIAFALATGALLLGSGGFYAVYILTRLKPPRIRMTGGKSFEVGWE
jgi:hypothetical protein